MADPARAHGLEAELRDSIKASNKADKVTASEHAILWWMTWMELEDQMPNEPLIIYGHVRWNDVYAMYQQDSALLWPNERVLKREHPHTSIVCACAPPPLLSLTMPP